MAENATDPSNHTSSSVSSATQSTASSSSKSSSRIRLVECGPMPGQPLPRGKGTANYEWAQTPAGQWVRVMATTAKLPNRERDKQRVENSLGLPEFGDTTTQFWGIRDHGFIPVGLGYDRIVYGDHGPYVEFSPEHICWDSFPNFVERPHGCYFDECYTADGLTMLYYQKRTVKNKANPPCGTWSVANNRQEGYANYVIGKLYVAAEPDTIAVCCARMKQRRRKRAGRGKKGKGGSGKGDDPLLIDSIPEEDGEDEESDGFDQEAEEDITDELADTQGNVGIDATWEISRWDKSSWESGEAWYDGHVWTEGSSWTEGSTWWRQDFSDAYDSRKHWATKKTAEEPNEIVETSLLDHLMVEPVVVEAPETISPEPRDMTPSSPSTCSGNGKIAEATHATEGGA